MGFEVASEGVVLDPELQSHAGRSRLTSTSSTLMCRTLADRFCVNMLGPCLPAAYGERKDSPEQVVA